MAQSKSSSAAKTYNQTDQQSGAGNVQFAGDKNHTVMGNETNVTNKNKTNVKADQKYNVGKNGTLTINNGLSDTQATGILDKIKETLAVNLGGSGGGGSSGGGTSIGYSIPPAVANQSNATSGQSSIVRWVVVAVAVIALAAFLMLPKKKKSS